MERIILVEKEIVMQGGSKRGLHLRLGVTQNGVHLNLQSKLWHLSSG